MDQFSPETQIALDSLMELAGLPQRGREITARAIQEAIDALKAQTMQIRLAGPPSPPPPPQPAVASPAPLAVEADSPLAALLSPEEPPTKSKTVPGLVYGGDKNVLLAAQLGIMIHQLRQSFSKAGARVTVASDVHDAIEAYKNQDYGMVIIDLFLPTEEEGLRLLDEIHRFSVICKIDTHIIVVAPPARKDTHLRDLCKKKGATIFLEKNEGWYNLILEYFRGEIDMSHFAEN